MKSDPTFTCENRIFWWYLKFELINEEKVKNSYRETLEKFDITTDEENDTVRYRQVHTYYFQPHLSNGSVDDVFTFINLPFVVR